MTTTFSIILEHVAAALNAEPHFVSCALDLPVRRIRHYEKNTHYDEDTLYVASTLPDAAECPAQLLCSSSVEIPEHSKNTAVFSSDISQESLYMKACNALSFYHAWGDQILDMIHNGMDLDAIVDFAYGVFKNPILIYDSSLKVLAYTRNDGSTDRMWQDTVQKGTVNSLSEEEARELQLYINKLDSSKKPFKHTASHLTDPFYNCNIILDGRRAGMVDLMERNHPVTKGELHLLEAFCYLLSFKLQQDFIRRENRGIIYHQLILDLLDGVITDASTLRSRLTATHWNPAPFTRVLSLQPENVFMAKPELSAAFEQLISLSIGRGVLLDREILFLLSCPQAQLSAGQMQMLHDFCIAHQLRCGVSDAHDTLLKTSVAAPQARRALSLSSERVVLFDSVRFDHLLRCCCANGTPEEILHPAALLLHSHDAAHNTDYIATLEALFACQYNQMFAARSLHIHRTTLIYRLQRISELTGLQLDDPREMLFLHLSLQIMQQTRKSHAQEERCLP